MTKFGRPLPAGAAVLLTFGVFGATSVQLAMAGGQATTPEAPPQLTMKQASQIAQSLFQIPSDYRLQNESFNGTSYGSQPQTYSFQYQEDQNKGNGSASVTVDANTGRIVSFNQPSADNQFKFPVPTSPSHAEQIAMQWASKLYPNQVNQVRAQPLQPQFGALTQPVQYVYDFERMVNGLPAPFDGFSITIDQDGRLVSVNDNWTNVTFPNPDQAISRTKAHQVYQKSLGLYLSYNTVYQNSGSPNTELLYTPYDTGYATWWNTPFAVQSVDRPVINGVTGEVIQSNGAVHRVANYQPPNPVVPGGPMLSAALKHVNWTESMVSQYVRDTLGLAPNAKLVSINEYQVPGGDTTWNMQWRAGNVVMNASVDATVGMLTSFGQYTIGTPKPAIAAAATAAGAANHKLSQAQIDHVAQSFIKRAYPNDTGALAIVPPVTASSAPHLRTSFQIVQLINGIPDQAAGGNLNVSAKTGQVTNLYMNLAQTQVNPKSLPLPSNAMTQQAATQSWISRKPLILEYLLTQPTSNVPGATNPVKAVLAYAPATPNGGSDQLNAVTGHFASTGSQQPYTGTIHDLNGSAGAAQVWLLVNRELLNVDANGDVHPDSNMSSGAFVKLVVDALGQQYRYQPILTSDRVMMASLAAVPAGSPAYHEVVTAYELGWLTQGQVFKPSQPITRGQAAVILMRALGYEPLLAKTGTLVLHASDTSKIPESQYNAAALAIALGTFGLESGAFHASGKVTVADAAIAVVQSAIVWGQAFPNQGPGVRY